MWSKIVRILGMSVLIGFSSVSIILYTLDFDHGALSYPSYFENRFYDLRSQLTRNDEFRDPDLVLAAIDEVSLKKIGRFPWTRSAYVPLMSKLKKFGAKVVAYDVVFSEPEKACNGEGPDEALAASFVDFQSGGDHSVILSYSLAGMHSYDDEISYSQEEFPEILYNFILDTQQSGEKGIEANRIMKTTFPIPTLLKTNPVVSYISQEEDETGIFRSYQVAANVDTLYLPSFALASYQALTGDRPKIEISTSGNGMLKLKNGSGELNSKGKVRISWSGPGPAFPTVGIWDILQAADDDPKMMKTFKGKAVFIGSTAFAAHDLRTTPVDGNLPGVYVHMNVVRMLLDSKFFQPKASSLKWSWVILVGGTVAVVLISLLGNAILDLTFVLLFCMGFAAFETLVLIPKGYEITLFFSLFSVIATYSWNTFLNFYFASKDKQFLKNAFGNYISPELIDAMYKSGEPPKLGGDSGVRTAFFTDIQGFSSFSEKLTATELVVLLNEYLTAMTDILLEEQGTLDKYEGDAIIAFFGAPMPLEDHASRSFKVAVRMQQALLKLRKKWLAEGEKWPQIVHDMRMRIGINSGEIVTGNMGSRSRMNYTMMGDSVNLAARLEESAKQYGIFTQVSSRSKELAGDSFICRELDTVRVVGKSEPVQTFDLLGIKGETEQELLDLQSSFHEALDLYKGKDWDGAISAFEKSLDFEYKRFPELKGKKTNPSLIYIERCRQFKENPPPAEWDGVYTLTSK